MDEPNKFTHVGVTTKTQRQIALLAKVHGCNIYDLVGAWTDSAWEIALQAGLVTDAMLEPQKAHVVGEKTIVKLDELDKKKLLEVVKVPRKEKAVKA